MGNLMVRLRKTLLKLMEIFSVWFAAFFAVGFSIVINAMILLNLFVWWFGR